MPDNLANMIAAGEVIDKCVNIVKEAGFKVAFVRGFRKSTREDNKFRLPRYPIQYDITMNEFIKMVN